MLMGQLKMSFRDGLVDSFKSLSLNFQGMSVALITLSVGLTLHIKVNHYPLRLP